MIRYMNSEPVKIYRIMDLRDLPSVIELGGIHSKSEVERRRIAFHNLAHNSIQSSRTRRQVNAQPGGIVSDYVPFYFCPRSPMLLTIHRGNVDSCSSKQKQIIHLVSTVDAVVDSGRRYVFTNQNASLADTKFSNDVRDMAVFLHWDYINARYWESTDEHPDRMRRKMAEFLVHHFFPWNLVMQIGVHDKSVKADVYSLIENGSHRPLVLSKPSWYY